MERLSAKRSYAIIFGLCVLLSLSCSSSKKLKADDSGGHESLIQQTDASLGVDSEASLGSVEKIFEYSESLKSRGFLEQMGTGDALRLPGITSEERGNILGLLDEIERAQNDLDAFRESPSTNQEETDRRIAAGQDLVRLRSGLAAADSAIVNRLSQTDKYLAARYTELRNPKLRSLAEAREWCGGDKAVLSFALWDNAIDYKSIKKLDTVGIRPDVNPYCIVITKDTAVVVPIDSAFDYAGAINRLRSEITLENNRYNNFIADMEEDRNALYDALIKPVLPYISKNIKNLAIVPDGVLGLLPFDVLRESEGGKDLGESYMITISPSVSISMLRKGNVARKLPVMALGNAWYSRHKTLAERERPPAPALIPTLRGAVIPDGKLYLDLDWNDLVSDSWIEDLRGLVSSSDDIKIVLGRDVSEENIKKLSAQGELARYPIFLISAHGHFDENDARLSGIVLSEVSGLLKNDEDGYLTVPEIARLNLDARMAMISACYSGMADHKRGGMVGIARSFMVAGANSVGASLWELADIATKEFLTRMYIKVLKEDLAFSEAFYQVKNEFRHHEEWKFPFYWAPFVLYE
jgi:CHAT domain-containing protein